MTFAAGIFLIACGDDDKLEDGGSASPDGGDRAKDSGTSTKDSGTATKDSGEPPGSDDAGAADDDAGTAEPMSFFVSSDTSKTGNLGGLAGADERCNKLAKAAGSKLKFAAYLSSEKNEKGEDKPVNARDRIGKGPWYNAKGALLAKDVESLHKLPSGNADLFLTEKGTKINGQWEGSPTPNEHDVLTGSNADGTLYAGRTCQSWTSEAAPENPMMPTPNIAQVGHSDGLGPMRNPNPPYNSWNSSHENAGCNDTAPRGGAGHIYCFAVE
jgi:hypothetical protein